MQAPAALRRCVDFLDAVWGWFAYRPATQDPGQNARRAVLSEIPGNSQIVTATPLVRSADSNQITAHPPHRTPTCMLVLISSGRLRKISRR